MTGRRRQRDKVQRPIYPADGQNAVSSVAFPITYLVSDATPVTVSRIDRNSLGFKEDI